jgi:subtilisin family serine protease
VATILLLVAVAASAVGAGAEPPASSNAPASSFVRAELQFRPRSDAAEAAAGSEPAIAGALTPMSTQLAIPPGGVGTVVMDGSGQVVRQVASPGPDAEEMVVVRLALQPTVAADATGRTAAAASDAPGEQRRRVAEEIVRIVGAGTGSGGGGSQRARARSSVIRHEYSRLWNGLAVRLPAGKTAAVRALPGVAAVYPDVEVEATLDQSVPSTHAPEVWSTYGYRGAGTVIAIIDTGIDYEHPDLGGCLGAGCKVLGGFDFVNDDADPRDDQGHGTHVASIAAGNGALLGVAPEASLLGYKVLDGKGRGRTSAVMAAIERAVDPDGDGDLSDQVDVINLSLGGQGDPEDPLSQMVDAAVASGVVVVVAAGNTGRTYGIQSPGVAKRALTVAASKGRFISLFTSKGPGPNAAFKPEIIAPGTEICAARALGTNLGTACLDSGHTRLSGTSMATPHVAGAAALLRGLRPELSAAQVKDTLVGWSFDLGWGVASQGVGGLDVGRAARAHTAIHPPALSFGFDDRTLSTWTSRARFMLRNLDSEPHEYALTAPEPRPGVRVALSRDHLTLAPGASERVTLALSVDNTQVPDGKALFQGRPDPFEGEVLIDTGGEKLRVPFIFTKAAVLRVQLTEPGRFVLAFDQRGFRPAAYESSLGAELFGAGDVDVLANWRGRNVFRENVQIKGITELSVDPAEAVYPVELTVRDEHDSPLDLLSRVVYIVHPHLTFVDFGIDFSLDYSHPYFPLFSPLSSAFQSFVAAHARKGETDFLFGAWKPDGLRAAYRVGNFGEDLVPVTASHETRPTDGEVDILWTPVFTSPNGYLSFLVVETLPIPMTRRSAMIAKPPSYPYPVYFMPTVIEAIPDYETKHYGGLVQTGPGPDTISVYRERRLDVPVFSPDDGEVPVQAPPPLWSLRMDNAPGKMGLRPVLDERRWKALKDEGWWWSLFGLGGDGVDEGLFATVRWRLRHDGRPIKTDVIPQGAFIFGAVGSWLRPRAQVRPGWNDLEVDGPLYWIAGVPGSSVVRMRFETEANDPNPPWFTNLSIRSEGRLTNRPLAGRPVEIALDVHDESLARVRLYVGTGASRRALAVTQLGEHRYVATIETCAPGPLRLTILAIDRSGNRVRQEMDPALVCS